MKDTSILTFIINPANNVLGLRMYDTLQYKWKCTCWASVKCVYKRLQFYYDESDMACDSKKNCVCWKVKLSYQKDSRNDILNTFMIVQNKIITNKVSKNVKCQWPLKLSSINGMGWLTFIQLYLPKWLHMYNPQKLEFQIYLIFL